MPDPIITLTTDFGRRAPYVAAVKGVVASLCPTARVSDLSHDIPPHDVAHGSFFLAGAVPYWPAGSIHVAVVDPGVGSARAALYACAGGRHFLAPDNGVLTGVLDALGGPTAVRRVENRGWFRDAVSPTFHGRDVFAPVAARLAAGAPADDLGPPVDFVRLPVPPTAVAPGQVGGAVAFVDDFGNLLTNVRAGELAGLCGAIAVRVGGVEIVGVRRTYADAEPGELFALVSSFDTLEIAVAHGSAARRLGVGVGAAVVARTLGAIDTGGG